ncbi:putative permease [Escherichia coli]|uniref:Putative permease n=1 Tax=Escherichia coli TaxID=562 RepID=A0A2X3K1C0_ECOLX|nr:putative permease [Escherichia coli]
MSSWLAMLQDAAEMFVFLAVELSLLFIVISAGVSLIRQKVPDHKIQQMMGARKGRGYLLAALLGAVTPFCSCSTIPMLRGLLSAKEPGLVRLSLFLFVSPLLNPIIVGLMWMTFGWKVTLLYAIIAAGGLRSCQYYPGFSGV